MINETVKKDALTRLKKIEGQVRGVTRMIEEEKYCIDIINQITAAEKALDGVARIVMKRHVESCVTEAIVRGGGAESLNVTVLYNSLAEWLRLQNAITGTSLIRSAQLDAIAPTGAMMTLEFRGQFGQLQRELDARGARLVEDPDLGLVVRSR